MNIDITYSFMIPALQWIAERCHSYGWAIILLTLAVRILVYPLVASSTRSMKQMSRLQPQLATLKTRYKDNPEMFQKKTMEFYQKNNINPVGGCLPMLVQLPILFALFATFSGPPFGDKAIPVKIKVVSQSESSQARKAETSGANSAYVSPDGKLCKLVVFPGDSTVTAGDSIDFGIRAAEGKMPTDLHVAWKIKNEPKDAHGASVDGNGHAVFPEAGEVMVEAVVPGVAKNESFGFIHSLGKVVSGMKLFNPDNWDNLVMIVLFGVTMYFSQKLMVQTPAAGMDEEQLKIQQQTQQTMPIAVTAMFFFIPLPSGVFLYMVVSNIMQSIQTWWIMRNPAPDLVSVIDDGPATITVQPKKKESKSNLAKNANNNGSNKDSNKESSGQAVKQKKKKK